MEDERKRCKQCGAFLVDKAEADKLLKRHRRIGDITIAVALSICLLGLGLELAGVLIGLSFAICALGAGLFIGVWWANGRFMKLASRVGWVYNGK